MMSYEQAEKERHERITAILNRVPLYPFPRFTDAYILELHRESKAYPRSLGALWRKFTPLYEKAKQTHDDMYEFLKKDFDLDTDGLAFQTFREMRLAEIFKEHVSIPRENYDEKFLTGYSLTWSWR